MKIEQAPLHIKRSSQVTDRGVGEQSGRARLRNTHNQKANARQENALESSEERGATPAMLICPALRTNVKTNCVATGIARAKWANLSVATFADKLAGAEKRLEVMRSLLVRKRRTSRADLKGDVRKRAPGQSRWTSPFQRPAHGLLAASGHVDFRHAVGIPRQSEKQPLLVVGLARLSCKNARF